MARLQSQCSITTSGVSTGLKGTITSFLLPRLWTSDGLATRVASNIGQAPDGVSKVLDLPQDHPIR